MWNLSSIPNPEIVNCFRGVPPELVTLITPLLDPAQG